MENITMSILIGYRNKIQTPVTASKTHSSAMTRLLAKNTGSTIMTIDSIMYMTVRENRTHRELFLKSATTRRTKIGIDSKPVRHILNQTEANLVVLRNSIGSFPLAIVKYVSKLISQNNVIHFRIVIMRIPMRHLNPQRQVLC